MIGAHAVSIFINKKRRRLIGAVEKSRQIELRQAIWSDQFASSRKIFLFSIGSAFYV